ncbi:unnamed protein product [Auanema sp. JU1783]|nr:unnamed protein product [Auanema sp. JU1783]
MREVLFIVLLVVEWGDTQLFGLLGGDEGFGDGGRGRFGGPAGPSNGGLLGGLMAGLNADLPNNRGNQQNQQNGGLLGSLLNSGNQGNSQLLDMVKGVAGKGLSILDASKKVDVLSDMERFRGGPKPSDAEWRPRAQKFCRRFPNHPRCSGGNTPMIGDLSSILDNLNNGISQFLPGIPRLNIRDPLASVNGALRGLLEGFQIKLGELDPEAAKTIKNVCRGRQCKQQPKNVIEKKRLVQAKMLEFDQQYTGKDTDNTDKIQLRLDRTQQLKEALLEKANLSSVVSPLNDGVFDSDILLTEDQAVFLLNDLGKGKSARHRRDMMEPEDFDTTLDGNRTAEELLELNERRKRSAMFFEENVIQQWDPNSPVAFVLDDSLEEVDKNTVRAAVKDIQSQTCLRFREYRTPPRIHHIVYYKVEQPTFCGLSYIGKTKDMSANPVYLSFQCTESKGVAIHETLHALGVAHQHLRFDRDQHITVDWSNINPQMYDSFVVVDSKIYTSYGVPYDYGSIMHYNAYTAASNVVKPTMIPKVDSQKNMRLLGQRRAMSARDVELVKKMYCMPGCKDTNVYCGAWALKGLCTNPNNSGWLLQNCKKSCNVCGR